MVILLRLLLITFACVSSTLVKEAVFRDSECTDLGEEQQVHFGECWTWTQGYQGCWSIEYFLAGSTLTTRVWEVKHQAEDFPDGTFCHPDETKRGCASIYTVPAENVSYQLDTCTELPERRAWAQGKFVKYTTLPPVSMTLVGHEDSSCSANKVVRTTEFAMEYCFRANQYETRSWRYVCGPENTTIEMQHFDNGNCSGPLNDWCVYNEDGSWNYTASGNFWCSDSYLIGCDSLWNMSVAENPCSDVISSFQAGDAKQARFYCTRC